jgi:hypothetical protein
MAGMLDIPEHYNKETYENGRTPRRGRKLYFFYKDHHSFIHSYINDSTDLCWALTSSSVS